MLAQRFIENNDKLVQTNQGNTYTTGAQDFTGATSVSVPTPSSSAHATTKSYVDTEIANAVVKNRPWKETLLSASQLVDGSAGGIAPAAALKLASNPSDGQTVIFHDGSSAVTLTFKDTAILGTDVQIETSAGATQANLAAAINSQVTSYTAVDSAALGSIGLNTIAVVRNSVGTSGDRIYGTASAVEYVDFGSQKYEAINDSLTAIPSSDPGSGGNAYGFRRAKAALLPNETHGYRISDGTSVWDSDGETWNAWPTTTYSAGDGLALSGGVFSVSLATDPGLQFSSGALKVKVNGGAGIGLDSNGVKIVLGSVPGLSFGSGLQVLANTNAGIALDTSGVKAKVADSAGTAFDGSGNVRIAADKETRATQSGATSGDGAATSLAIDFDNDGGGCPEVFVGQASGFKVANGDSERTTADCYFSADSGSTARAWSAIVSTDVLYWNGTVAPGGNLANGDKLRVKSASLG
jgi:hypothetical protein